MKQIILASSSPRRKALLQQIGLKFKVDAGNIEEKLNPRLKPRGNAEQLSLLKAKAVATKYSDAMIIAADTLVILDEEIIGKPKDEKDVRRILHKLSGRAHVVVTGFTITDTVTKKTVTKSVETNVYFKRLSEKEIDGYLDTGEPFNKAGAYGMQDKGGIFIAKVEGEWSNVVGLPLCALYEELKKFGVKII